MNTNQSAQNRIKVAKIATAHGIRGLVKVFIYLEDAASLKGYGALYTSPTSSDTLPLTLKSSSGKYWLGSIKDVTDRTKAETFRGQELWVESGKRKAAPKDEFYNDDLIGMAAQDTNGTALGKIIDVSNFGAGDLLEIETAEGNESFYLPFTKENVPDINLKKKMITVIIPEGLLE